MLMLFDHDLYYVNPTSPGKIHFEFNWEIDHFIENQHNLQNQYHRDTVVVNILGISVSVFLLNPLMSPVEMRSVPIPDP